MTRQPGPATRAPDMRGSGAATSDPTRDTRLVPRSPELYDALMALCEQPAPDEQIA